MATLSSGVRSFEVKRAESNGKYASETGMPHFVRMSSEMLTFDAVSDEAGAAARVGDDASGAGVLVTGGFAGGGDAPPQPIAMRAIDARANGVGLENMGTW